MKPDQKDIQILNALQDNGRITNAALAKQLNMAQAPMWRRVKALQKCGALKGFSVILDHKALGFELTAFVSVRFASHDPDLQQAFEQQVLQMPDVMWCHNVSGANDFLLCVVARNVGEYGEIISGKLRALPGVTSIESTFSLKAVKSGFKLPIA